MSCEKRGGYNPNFEFHSSIHAPNSKVQTLKNSQQPSTTIHDDNHRRSVLFTVTLALLVHLFVLFCSSVHHSASTTTTTIAVRRQTIQHRRQPFPFFSRYLLKS
ncbi:hypothetical protein HanRHA438_Chr03g0130071 [Helianthus annuus]|nr:hypothetical protein HanRHA438_Chr03g0130071 [Helianthus annuus]